ncbi:hypothetical protein SPI_07084 [Niveomyces insectorum RCEF 264]|uniref:Transmembrane protein n=1 Tax=Niveomyces insectorum RCEF 264 TaxID=1081102 RepID=A0A167Q9C2_9HYPO|nr:hypothetical protein SPI_07084 [Niveomyces insectorum RCEF 264]
MAPYAQAPGAGPAVLQRLPTRTTVPAHLHEFLLRVRQASTSTVTVQSSPADTKDNSSSNNQLSGGAIAGIVIGSVAGFLLLLWIIRSFTNLGAPPAEREAWYDDAAAPTYRRDGHHHRHHRHRDRDRDRYYSDGSGYPPRSYSTSRRPSTTIAEPVPVVVRSNSRRRASTSRPPRSPRKSGGGFIVEEQRGRSHGRYSDSY